MPDRGRAGTASAQQLDPLSWFTGPLVPLTFCALIVAYGAVMSIITYSGQGAVVQPLAIVLCASACIVIHVATRPVRPQIGLAVPILAVAISLVGAVVSATGYRGSSFTIAYWWAPGAVALTIASLGPYLSARRVIGLGGFASVAIAIVCLVVLGDEGSAWGPVGTAIIASYPPVLGTVATATFSWAVVTTLLGRSTGSAGPSAVAAALDDDSASEADRVARETVERITARAVPFIESIAGSARVKRADRALAAELARLLRDDLVLHSDQSWLDFVADVPHLVVVDADRRARTMNIAQRTALRALIRAILDIPGIDKGSLVVDVRAAEDGATAVAVSLDRELPEGHTIMHLAPYYLTLASTVDDLSVARDRLLRVSFRLAPKRKR
jgi:hypothetical protein